MDILYTEPCSSSGSSSNGEYPFSTVARSLLSKHMDSLQLQKALQQNHQIFMESPLVHGSSYMGLIFIIVIVLFALAHARLTKLDLFSALKRFEQWRQQEKPEVTQKQLDQERRYEEKIVANTDADTGQAEHAPNPHWIRTDLFGASRFTTRTILELTRRIHSIGPCIFLACLR